MAKTAPTATPRVEVGLVCDSGTSRTGLHGLTDLFSYAGEFAAKRHGNGASSSVRIVHWLAADGSPSVATTYDTCPELPNSPSVLVLPGNERAARDPVPDGPLITWLRGNHSRGVVLAAVCGGVFVLAKTGLLTGRQATTHWALAHQFATQYPEVLTETDRMLIDYQDVVTAGGVLAWADLGLRLTERFLGHAIMMETARYMNVDPPGREQRFYSDFAPRMKHGDNAILKAQLWLATQRDQHVSVVDVASHACLEPRTFLRRFVRATGMKPIEYQQRLLVSRARELLEFSRKSVEEVAASSGYSDVGAFRRVFHRIVGLTPSDYRRRFCNDLSLQHE